MWDRLDYIGIVVLIVGSVIAVLYFTFYCHPVLRTIYVSITSFFGILATYVTLSYANTFSLSLQRPSVDFHVARSSLTVLQPCV